MSAFDELEIMVIQIHGHSIPSTTQGRSKCAEPTLVPALRLAAETLLVEILVTWLAAVLPCMFHSWAAALHLMGYIGLTFQYVSE